MNADIVTTSVVVTVTESIPGDTWCVTVKICLADTRRTPLLAFLITKQELRQLAFDDNDMTTAIGELVLR